MLGQCQDSVRHVMCVVDFQLSRVQGSDWILAASVQGQFSHSCHSLLRGKRRHRKPRRTALQVTPHSSGASDSACCLASHCCCGGGGGGGVFFSFSCFCVCCCFLLRHLIVWLRQERVNVLFGRSDYEDDSDSDVGGHL